MPNSWLNPGGFAYVLADVAKKAAAQANADAADALTSQSDSTTPDDNSGIFGWLKDQVKSVTDQNEPITAIVQDENGNWVPNIQTTKGALATAIAKSNIQRGYQINSPTTEAEALNQYVSTLPSEEQASVSNVGNVHPGGNPIDLATSKIQGYPGAKVTRDIVGPLANALVLEAGRGVGNPDTTGSSDVSTGELARVGLEGSMGPRFIPGASVLPKVLTSPRAALGLASAVTGQDIYGQSNLPGAGNPLAESIVGIGAGGLAEGGAPRIGNILKSAVRPRAGVNIPAELAGLSDDEISAIARDRTDPRQAAARNWITRDFASVTGPTAARGPMTMADIPNATDEELGLAQAKPGLGARLKKAISDEIERRLSGNAPRLGVTSGGEELSPQELSQGMTGQPAQETFGPEFGNFANTPPVESPLRTEPQASEPSLLGSVVNPEATPRQLKPGEVSAPTREAIPPKPALTLERAINGFSNTVRGMTTLGDIAIGRLSSTAAVTDTGNFFRAIRQGVQETLRPGSNAEFIKSLEDVPGEAKTWYRAPEDGGYGLQGNPEELKPGLIGKVPVLGQVANLQRNVVDAMRPLILKARIANLLESGDITENDLLKPEVRADIGRSVNLVTGGSSIKFFQGPTARIFLNFPNWLASQVELNLRAFEQGTVTGDIARKAILRNLAVGAAVTEAVNMASGRTMNPVAAALAHTRNGIPQAQLPGTDWTFDAFGPTVDLLSTLAGIGVRTATGGIASAPTNIGSGLFNFYRSQAGPIPRIAIDQLKKSDFVGNPVDDGSQRAWNLVQNILPFNAAGAVEGRQAGAGALGTLGIRTHQPSELAHALNQAGINPDNEDYLIQRRQFEQDNPEYRTANDTGALLAKVSRERSQLSQDVMNNPSITLKDFRDRRTAILNDERSQLQALGAGSGQIKGPHADWLTHYYDLFQQASTDPSNPQAPIDQVKFDSLYADYLNSLGSDASTAQDFINRYLVAGTPTNDTVERAYLNDLRTLDAAGYFNTSKYQNLRSNLSDDELDKLKTQVDAWRAQDPLRSRMTMLASARQALPDQPEAVIVDVANLDKKLAKNPERTKLQQQYAKQLLWFNPNANWQTYTNYNARPTGGTTTGIQPLQLAPIQLAPIATR